MADGTVFNDARILLDAYDISGFMNRVTYTRAPTVVDKTCFNDSHKKKKKTTRDWNIDGGGFIDLDASGSGSTDPEDALWAANNASETTLRPGSVLTVAQGDGVVGNIAWLGFAPIVEFRPSGQHDELLQWEFRGEGTGSHYRGFFMFEHSFTAAGTENGSAVQIGAITSGQTFAATVHCTAFDAATLDVKLQSSVDGVSGWADYTDGGFTQLTDVGSELITGTTTETDTYWRVVATLAGGNETATVKVAAAIK